MAIYLPQDPRVVQQQQFAQQGINALIDLFQSKEDAKKEAQANLEQQELLRAIFGGEDFEKKPALDGLIDESGQFGAISQPNIPGSVAFPEIQGAKKQMPTQEDELAKLQKQEDLVLASRLDDKAKQQFLSTIRSRRNLIAQELAGGEKEAGKEAAKRRSKKIETVGEKAEAAAATITAVEGLEQIVDTGKTGPSLKNALINATQGQGGVLGAVGDFLSSAEKQGFDSASRAFFPQLKAFFGARITDTDLRTFMSTLARFGTDPKAQKLALATLRQQAEFDSKLGSAALNLLDEDGKPVKNFEKRLNEARQSLEKESREAFRQTAKDLGIVPGENPMIQTNIGEFSYDDLLKEARERNLLK